MESPQESRYVNRTQKDYPMSFKLQIVQEIEHGRLTATEATKKYGIQCKKTVVLLRHGFSTYTMCLIYWHQQLLNYTFKMKSNNNNNDNNNDIIMIICVDPAEQD